MNPTRRSFLKLSALAIVSAPFLKSLLGAVPALATDTDLPMATETADPAKSLKYCSNADKPSKNCAARKAKDKKDQYCYNCQLFQKQDGEKKLAKGKCMIMPNRVPGNGWCQSWVQNPAVKS
jgi:hypothetical protein